jgi:hypothetical protein
VLDPEDGETELTVAVFDCPGEAVSRSRCAAAGEGIGFTLSPQSEGEPIELETDEDGIARATVDPGLYALEELGGDWCFADSVAFDEDGLIQVDHGDVEIAIYHCEA